MNTIYYPSLRYPKTNDNGVAKIPRSVYSLNQDFELSSCKNAYSVRKQNVENLKGLLLSFCEVFQQIRSYDLKSSPYSTKAQSM